MSTVQESDIETSSKVKFPSAWSIAMGQAEDLMARVRQLPDLIGKSDTELAEHCGVSPQQWSNYKAEGRHYNELPWRVALCLWDSYGIPMQWLYDGQTNSRDLSPEMREKLAQAERRAQNWLAGRRPRGGPAPKSRIVRAAILSLAGAFLVMGAGVHGSSWKRADGRPMAYAQFVADMKDCDLAAGTVNLREGYLPEQKVVFAACMDAAGYSRGL